MNTNVFTPEQIQLEQSAFITKVYAWMSAALAVTGLIAIWTISTPAITELVIENKFIFILLLIIEIACVAYLLSVIKKISSQKATLIFFAYAALNGFTFAALFFVYTSESIASTFLITACTFAVMSGYGYFTKTDLTGAGNMAVMGLLGLIMASLVNFFFESETLYWITTYSGVIIFVVLTAYDTQKIKNLNIIGNEGTEEDKKEAIMGALLLYLDFINLFLYLLRLLGKKK